MAGYRYSGSSTVDCPPRMNVHSLGTSTSRTTRSNDPVARIPTTSQSSTISTCSGGSNATLGLPASPAMPTPRMSAAMQPLANFQRPSTR